MPFCVGVILVGAAVYLAGLTHPIEILFSQTAATVFAAGIAGLVSRLSARRAAGREADAREEWFRANYARSAALVRSARTHR